MQRFLTLCLVICASLTATNASSQQLEEIRVSTRRLPDSVSEAIYSSVRFDRSALNGAAFGLDDSLRRLPGFGLFRRQASRAAHPTTQGVSLRGLGPNGAGRTLVVLDGVPQNDPFGGWVEWVHLPPLTIEQATLVRGGGAGVWGNAALAGVVRLDSRVLDEQMAVADLRHGSKDTWMGSALAESPIGAGTFSITAHASDGEGYFLIGTDQRGAADRRAARRNEGVRLAWRVQSDNGTLWSISGSAASDSFVNGSDVAGTQTDTYDLSIGALNENAANGLSWQSVLYVRHKDFSSTFGAFDGTRDTVRPVLDQFDVPATVVGGNLVVRSNEFEAWTVESGMDVRFSDGETNELFRNLGAGFTRERTAGGKQLVTGAFLEGHWQQTNRFLFTIGGRVDHWRQSNGNRRESNLIDGTVLVDRTFTNQNGWVANGRVGFRADVKGGLSVKGAAYSGFRVPTLNELYRPFRVGNDITEANNGLENERIVGVDLSFTWSSEHALAAATLFRNDIHDPVINATVTTTPGFNTEFGVFIPGGGSLRQRRNVDRVETWGMEIDTELTIAESASIRAAYLFTSPKIKKSTVSPILEGNRLAQVARHQGTIGLELQPNDRISFTVDVLASSNQFEDDLNSRVLNSVVTVDTQLSYKINDGIEAYVAAENLFDTRIEAGRSASGLVTLGAPIFLWVGLRLAY